jgi:hypothetical protein
MKYIKLMFVGLLLGCGVSALLKVITAAPTKCKEPYRQDTKITIGTNVINAEIEVKANASPSTYPDNFTNTEPAKYVLEIQADRSRQLNIAQGTQLEFNL